MVLGGWFDKEYELTRYIDSHMQHKQPHAPC